jgi:small conductance mechanosensitive channel
MVLFALSFAAPALAQESETANPGGIPAEAAQAIDAELARTTSLFADVQRLEAQAAGAEGLALQVLEARLARFWDELIATSQGVVERVLALQAAGQDIEPYREAVQTLLTATPKAIFSEIDRARANITLPNSDQSAAEQGAIDAYVGIAFHRVVSLYKAVSENLAQAEAFGLPTQAITAELHTQLEERASYASAFLDIAILEADAARVQLSALPADTEIAGNLNVAEARVKMSSRALQGITAIMSEQGLDSSVYDSQLIATTGEITTDILDVSVLSKLTGDWFAAIGDWFAENGAGLFFSALVFLAIVLITFKVAKIVQGLADKALAASGAKLSKLLRRMIVSSVRGVIIVLGLLIALSQLGISLGPLLAGLGIAGFVIGFALQDSLANFASGMLILLYRPFDVGDLVEVGSGTFGTVSEMSLVNTTILTLDNQTLIVPNNSIWQNVIKNVTAQKIRRVDLTFGIGYSDDIPKAEKILTDIIESHEAVLKDPEPFVRLHELGESSVNFIVRPWVRTDDYWPLYWDITREVKMRFDAEGISIPFPQRDVHLFAEAPIMATNVHTEGTRQDSVPGHRKAFDSAGDAPGDD